MKKNTFCIILAAIFIITSCKSKSSTPAEQTNSDTTPSEFYPISSFVISQIKKLDSLPLAVIKYTTISNKTDTSIVEKKDFAAVARYFVSPDITSPELKKLYEETSLIDASLGIISLIYTTQSDTAATRKADVLLNQETTNVKSVYVEKNKTLPNGILIQKMLWTADRNCQITSIEQIKGSPEKVTVEKYVWDDRP